ncbi:MAG: hypothetical protein HN413_15160 [Chloroflexi bacterium]|nr:hypothetical protein [Chloroflexota bacterium]
MAAIAASGVDSATALVGALPTSGLWVVTRLHASALIARTAMLAMI